LFTTVLKGENPQKLDFYYIILYNYNIKKGIKERANEKQRKKFKKKPKKTKIFPKKT